MDRRSFIAGSALALATSAARADPGQTAGKLRFPRDFAWGVSTSAFQIEGALDADGRGKSIWDDAITDEPAIADGPAINHYYRWREDIALLRQLKLPVYRFSVAWPRVLPEGKGAVNQRGLDFYDRLVDGLLAAGITPFLCLHHWDLPLAVQARGGWPNRAIVDDFTRYAEIVAGRLGDRVRHWIAINEAFSIAFGGYGIGFYPPMIADEKAYFAAAHHLNLAQGAAFKALAAPGREFGTAMCLYPVRPATPSDADVAAARFYEAMSTKLFLDPLLRGRYPDLVESRIAPFLHDGDLAMIEHRGAFIGVNYYTPELRRSAPGARFGTESVKRDGVPETGNGWTIEPDGLYDQLIELRDAYGNPRTYVTENGAAFADSVDSKRRIDDEARIAFLRAHLTSAHRAHDDGANLCGYFIWSIADNYEWWVGFGARFGLVYVNAETGERLPKRSFDWYREVIASGAV
jgi:beta-glucosidase